MVRGIFIGTFFSISLFLPAIFFIKLPENKILFSFDHILSDEACNNIRSCIQKNYAHSWKYIAKTIKEQHHYIQSILIKKNVHSVQILIKAYRPAFLVNEQYILCKQLNQLFDKALFDTQKINNIYRISICSSTLEKELPYVCVWLERCDSFFDQFNVYWHDHTKIFLQHKQTQQLIKTAYHIALHQAVYTWAQEALHQESLVKKELNPLIADIRFEGQIVVYRRGENNEDDCFFT